MKDLFLVRHGQAQDGASGMDRDFHLTELGRQQAHAAGCELSRCLPPLAAIYASRLTRARETAEIIGQYVPAPLRIREDLIEHGSGVFLLDCSRTEAARLHSDCLRPDGGLILCPGEGPGLNWNFTVGGENLRMLHCRALSAYRSILAAHPGPEEACMVVAHGSLLSAMLSEALQIPLRAVWSLQMANAACLHLRLCANELDPAGEPHAQIMLRGPLGEQTFAKAERIVEQPEVLSAK